MLSLRQKAMKYIIILLSVLLLGQSGKSQSCDELLLSFYMEGSGSNKAIGIYNPSLATRDLSPYQLKFYFNGATDSSGTVLTIDLTGDLDGGQQYILSDDAIDSSVLPYHLIDSLYTGGMFNGDDAVGLYKDSFLIDVLGTIGVDPDKVGGTDTGFGSGGGVTVNATLVRRANAGASAMWQEGEWIPYPADAVEGIPLHLSCCFYSMTTQMQMRPDTGVERGTAWVITSGGMPPYTYAWSNGATDSFAKGLHGGVSYSVQVGDDAGCVMADSIWIPKGTFASSIASKGSSVWPNPVSGAGIWISTSDSEQKEIMVFDLTGREREIRTRSRSTQTYLDLSELGSGLYFLVLKMQGQKQIFKLIRP
jgi:hypothetical protein